MSCGSTVGGRRSPTLKEAKQFAVAVAVRTMRDDFIASRADVTRYRRKRRAGSGACREARAGASPAVAAAGNNDGAPRRRCPLEGGEAQRWCKRLLICWR